MRVQFEPIGNRFVFPQLQKRKNQIAFKSMIYNPDFIINRYSSVAKYLFSFLQKTVSISRGFWLSIDKNIRPYIKEVEIPNIKQKTMVRLWDINKNKDENINNQKYVIVMHGLCHNISSLQGLYDKILQKTDYSILAQEYSGFRECDTGYKYIQPKGLLQDAELGLNYLKEKGIKEKNIYVIGHSFGGFVASQLAARHKDIGGLILVSPCYSMRTMTERILEGNEKCVPTRVQKKIKTAKIYHKAADMLFPVKKSLKKVKSRVDIVHSKQDRYAKLTTVKELADSCVNLHSFYLLQTGHHKMDDEKIKAIISSLNQDY